MEGATKAKKQVPLLAELEFEVRPGASPMMKLQIDSEQLEKALAAMGYQIKEPVSVKNDPIATKNGAFVMWFKTAKRQ